MESWNELYGDAISDIPQDEMASGGGGDMDFEEIYGVVCARMEQSLREEAGIDPVSFSMIPSKPRPEGLGFTTENAWYLHLLVYQSVYLPDQPPYRNKPFDSVIASKIYNKALDAGCYDLTTYLLS